MSEVIEAAVKALSERTRDKTLPGSAKFVIKDEGSVRVDESGVHADDGEADVTLTASVKTFKGLMEGNVNPATAFMTGRLKVKGDMGMAMKLAGLLG